MYDRSGARNRCRILFEILFIFSLSWRDESFQMAADRTGECKTGVTEKWYTGFDEKKIDKYLDFIPSLATISFTSELGPKNARSSINMLDWPSHFDVARPQLVLHPTVSLLANQSHPLEMILTTPDAFGIGPHHKQFILALTATFIR